MGDPQEPADNDLEALAKKGCDPGGCMRVRHRASRKNRMAKDMQAGVDRDEIAVLRNVFLRLKGL